MKRIKRRSSFKVSPRSIWRSSSVRHKLEKVIKSVIWTNCHSKLMLKRWIKVIKMEVSRPMEELLLERAKKWYSTPGVQRPAENPALIRQRATKAGYRLPQQALGLQQSEDTLLKMKLKEALLNLPLHESARQTSRLVSGLLLSERTLLPTRANSSIWWTHHGKQSSSAVKTASSLPLSSTIFLTTISLKVEVYTLTTRSSTARTTDRVATVLK